MSQTEDIPQPENGFYVLVTGANRYGKAPHTQLHTIDIVQRPGIGHRESPDRRIPPDTPPDRVSCPHYNHTRPAKRRRDDREVATTLA